MLLPENKLVIPNKNQMTMPLWWYTGYDDASLRFHLLDVGEGLMCLIIFPDKTTMLFDCNLREEERDTILQYLAYNLPLRYDMEQKSESQWIDVFVNSHRDDDHFRGLKYVNEAFSIRSIWDSGQTGDGTQSNDYKYYMQLRRTLIGKYGDDAVKVPVPSSISFADFGEANVFCLCSGQDYDDTDLKEAKIQHSNSIVLSIQYAERSLLLTGDSDWLAWRDKIVPNFEGTGLLEATVLIASHHGSRSFFTNETQNEIINPDENHYTTYVKSIDHIAPLITLIPCGEYDTAHHPCKEAMKIYREKTANEKHRQIYTTNEKGTLVGFIGSTGEWTVVPSRFRKTHSGGKVDFAIKCEYLHNGYKYEVQSSQRCKVGGKLKFIIESRGQLIEPSADVMVYWEVSNGGIDSDHEHQEIYYKDRYASEGKFSFARDLTYEGTHLLRCKIWNKKKKHVITRVFVLNAVP